MPVSAIPSKRFSSSRQSTQEAICFPRPHQLSVNRKEYKRVNGPYRLYMQGGDEDQTTLFPEGLLRWEQPFDEVFLVNPFISKRYGLSSWFSNPRSKTAYE